MFVMLCLVPSRSQGGLVVGSLVWSVWSVMVSSPPAARLRLQGPIRRATSGPIRSTRNKGSIKMSPNGDMPCLQLIVDVHLENYLQTYV